MRAFTQAYLASVAAVDDCLGQVLDALDNSRFRDNTIVVVTSDHGWNMGQKDWLFKMSLWEESCRVPLSIRAPGVTQAGKPAKVRTDRLWSGSDWTSSSHAPGTCSTTSAMKETRPWSLPSETLGMHSMICSAMARG